MGGCLGFLFIIGVIVLAIWAISKSIQEAEADRKAEEAEIARQHSERARDAAEQADLKRQMLALNEESLRALESLPLKLESAERHLDRAETDFAEEAFAPFWDSIEKAANELAGFDQGVHVVRNSSSTYIDLSKRFRGARPVFAISPASSPKLKIASATAQRMSGIVRTAQRNFQFAMIYEQRKTNQILVSGFKNLAQALEEMTWRITSSIDDVTASVNRMSSTLDKSLQEIHEHTGRIAADTAAHRGEAAARTEREKKALEMLDNIQRKRYPSITLGGLK
jgi:hypothetical protein